MKRFTRAIERKRATIFRNMNIEQNIRIVKTHRRAFTSLVTEIVNNGILYFISHELGVTEFIRKHHRIYGETLFGIQIFLPIYSLYIIVHFISRLCLEMFDGFKDSDSGAQTEICFIQHGLVSCESHHTVPNLNIAGAQLRQFLCQNLFQSLKSLSYQLEFLLHCM